MNRSHRWAALWLFLVLFPSLVPAQESVPTYAQLAFPLENQGDSARAMALGSAFVAVGGDIASLSWNPAGLAGLSRTQLALHHEFYLQDLTRDTVAIASPMGNWGSLGFSVGYLGYGSLQGRDVNGNVTGNYGAGRWGAEAAWGVPLFTGFSAGLGLKENLLQLSGTSYTNTAFDLGLLWDPAPGLHLGGAWSNIGTDVASYVADSAVRLGLAYDARISPGEQILLAGGFYGEPYGVTRLDFGAEALIASFLSLRGGYVWNFSSTGLEGLTGATAGLGFQFKDFTLDYGYSPFGNLGDSNQFSLTYSFGASSPQPPPKTALPVPAAAAPASVAAPPADAQKLELLFSLPDTGQGAAQTQGSEWSLDLAEFQKAIAQNPSDSSAWLGLGKLYDQAGLRSQALQCFEQVGRLKPGDTVFQAWLKNYRHRWPGSTTTPVPATPTE